MLLISSAYVTTCPIADSDRGLWKISGSGVDEDNLIQISDTLELLDEDEDLSRRNRSSKFFLMLFIIFLVCVSAVVIVYLKHDNTELKESE